jgi:protein-disulfide isomerase
MRGSSALALSLAIGAVIGATVMGVPAIRQHFIPAPVASAPVAAPVPDAASAVVAEKRAPEPEAAKPVEVPQPAPADTAARIAAPAPAADNSVPAPTPTATIGENIAKFDVKKALQDRVLGNPDAPVTFYDYSSLSCPHCADFHTKTLLQIRRDYIDPGKVKMVFRPFPLNEPALLGEKIARCVPEDQYFKVLDMLFSNQDKWVYAANVKDALRQMTKVAGVTDALFDSCMANNELEQGIMQIASEGVARHNLKGTPTFVFGSDMPNADTVAGEISYQQFAQKLDALLNGQDPASVTTSSGAASSAQ